MHRNATSPAGGRPGRLAQALRLQPSASLSSSSSLQEYRMSRPIHGLARRTLLVALPLLALAAAHSSAGAATLEEIKKRGYLVVATEDDFRPFEFVKDGKPTGFDNEMVEDAEEVRALRDPPGDPALDRHPGRASAPASTTSPSPPRSSPRSACSRSTSPARSPTRRTTTSSARPTRRSSAIKDLSGKTIGVQAGSALLGRLPELKAMIEKNGGKMGKVVEYTSYPEAYQDLALGRTDYRRQHDHQPEGAGGREARRVRARPAGVGQVVSRPGPSRRATPSCSAFLNEFIAKEKASGTIAELQKKWFGEAFPDLPVTLHAGVLSSVRAFAMTPLATSWRSSGCR